MVALLDCIVSYLRGARPGDFVIHNDKRRFFAVVYVKTNDGVKAAFHAADNDGFFTWKEKIFDEIHDLCDFLVAYQIPLFKETTVLRRDVTMCTDHRRVLASPHTSNQC
ncbi:unnamed protein product [Caenorhabditis auriculariae]|uniref:Uncharacterized protein n=1 Tax=Caenorhabditis auriculariae TaxID=2777116 RepID=A0A8S1H4N5_9PELO|nr:unnamed protein product [Caenorhabditis auriculariae]